MVALTIAGALVMNWVVAAEQIPEAMGAWMIALNLSPGVFMFVVTILFLLLGAFLDTMLMLLIIVPMLMPTVLALGIDPVHFGVVSVVNMMIGLDHPADRRVGLPDGGGHRHQGRRDYHARSGRSSSS